MKRARKRGSPIAVVVAAALAIGFGLGWTLRGHAPRPAIDAAAVAVDAAPRTDSSSSAPSAATDLPAARQPVATGGRASAIDELREHDLRVPIDGASVAAFKDQFADRRENGSRPHEAVDILAPRNTPVHAVENGTVAKLFFSKGGGGNTIYQFDPTGRYCYYYAHLERYAPGLKAGEPVSRGDVIGFVGTSGNAPPNTPHLHFAVYKLGPEREWWKGVAIDPYLVFSR
jgi:peptidoglycan LD-endopeptidase LytH